MHNRRVAFSQVPEPALMGGVMPCGPLNEMGMLTDYVAPEPVRSAASEGPDER